MAEQARQSQQQQHLRVLAPGQIPKMANWDDFEKFALEHPDQQWELCEGVVREKPGMASEHNDAVYYLALDLGKQLDRRVYRVRTNSTHVQRTTASYLIPDICVFSTTAFRQRLGQPNRLEMYDEPMFLIIEIWSRSTGGYDINTKIPEYQARGDLEIWRLHPYERTLKVWRRNSDGTYTESNYEGGSVTVASLPKVVVDLDALFAFE